MGASGLRSVSALRVDKRGECCTSPSEPDFARSRVRTYGATPGASMPLGLAMIRNLLRQPHCPVGIWKVG